ncbi:MAG: ATP-binding protein [Bacilli bacterium]|nr:ATP-binding protein [Bacilli bacterium]
MEELDEYEIALAYGHYVLRDVYDRLKKWKQTEAREKKCLFLRGARRVGKSCLALEFAHKEYRSFLKVSFEKASPETKELFVNCLEDLDTFYDRLSVTYGKRLYPGESLIILDEIQLFKPARQAIKTLLLDGRFDILETGSLASIVKKGGDGDYLLPSEEIKVDIQPITFKEYLVASGNEDLADFITMATSKRIPYAAAYRRIYREFRHYLFVGGMPKCVATYLKSKDLVKVEQEKRGILELYYDDFSKQENVNSLYLSSIFNLIPSELSHHDKRFKLVHINASAREREYGPAFRWLKDAELVNVSFNATEPSVLPLLNADGNDIKAYFLDTGLLYSLCFSKAEEDELFYKSLVYDKLHINEGMFLENYVAQVLRNKGYRELFFFEKRSKETRKTTMEIDFLYIHNRKISPIEVKSSESSSITSLLKFKEAFKGKVGEGVVLHDGEYKEKEGVSFFPLFAADWVL